MPAPQPVAEYRLAIDELDKAIHRLAAHLNAGTYELLVLIREFDERAGWLKWGFDSCTQWLHWRCGLGLSAAREKIRVAHAIKDLPQISAAFASGALSYSKVRALTRAACSDNEASLCDFAMTTTAARVEERCRQLRNVQPDSAAQADRAYANRSLSIWRNATRGTMTITVELPLEQGELVSQALDKAAAQSVANGPELESETWRAQQADALVHIAMSHLNGGAKDDRSGPDNYQVVIHVDESALTGGEGRSDLPIDAIKRLTCDGSMIGLVENAAGEPLNAGRKQRTLTTAIRRALEARDRCCRFPGCTHTKYLHAHHIRHWADGGETSLENLVLFCSQHHRLFHEGGYTIAIDSAGRLCFRRPDGRAIPACGYRREDMIDDDIDAGVNPFRDASAEGATSSSDTTAKTNGAKQFDEASGERAATQSCDLRAEEARQFCDAATKSSSQSPDLCAESSTQSRVASADGTKRVHEASLEGTIHPRDASAAALDQAGDASAEGAENIHATSAEGCALHSIKSVREVAVAYCQ